MGTPAVARFARQITFSSVISYLGKPHFHHRYFQKKETFSSRESELFFFKCQMKQRFGHRSAKWPTNDCCHGWHSPSCTSRYLRCETPVFVLFVEMLLDFVIMLRGETPFLQLPVRDEEDGW